MIDTHKWIERAVHTTAASTAPSPDGFGAQWPVHNSEEHTSELLDEAQAIVRKYVGAIGGAGASSGFDGVKTAEQEVNLPDAVAQRLRSRMEHAVSTKGRAAPLDTGIFDEARSEIDRLVSQDTLPRFLTSTAFRELRTRLLRSAYGAAAAGSDATSLLCFDDVDEFEAAVSRAAAQVVAASRARKLTSAAQQRADERRASELMQLNQLVSQQATSTDLGMLLQRRASLQEPRLALSNLSA